MPTFVWPIKEFTCVLCGVGYTQEKTESTARGFTYCIREYEGGDAAENAYEPDFGSCRFNLRLNNF